MKNNNRYLKKGQQLVNREISWLAFNERVLQEAMDESVPLIERIRFLGIFSNNRDEFFRVRVATLKRIIKLGHKATSYLQGNDPQALLEEIHRLVLRQERKFTRCYRQIIHELQEKDIHIVDEKNLNVKQAAFVENFFREKIRSALVPILLGNKKDFPSLKEQTIYLAIKMIHKKEPDKNRFALMEVPTTHFGRFLILPQDKNSKYLILLEDVIRHCLSQVFTLFNFDSIESYTIKMTRDAELDLDDDISKTLAAKISKSLRNRATARLTRLIYDKKMPEDLFNFIVRKLKITRKDNLIAGGRYHNFRDFIKFPYIGVQKLRNVSLAPLRHPDLDDNRSLLSVIAKKDILLYYPYHVFNYVIDILREAAIDPKVRSIQICLYRVASDSKIINALTNAVKNGKSVTVLLELHARFDEEANIAWSGILTEAGVKVIHGVPGLKVHSKIFLITRKEDHGHKQFAHIGTGNFHEGTARIYTDHTLLTSNPKITKEIAKIFDFFRSNYKVSRYSELTVSPINTRRNFLKLINVEIRNAKAGKQAWIFLKMNNLLDEVLVRKLYDASAAGVRIRIIIRGICALVPGVKDLSENIEARSIVDRFLEHSRVVVFCHAGKPKYYISSADWMVRNLDKRIEVSVPVNDPGLQKQLMDVLELQWSDNQKARTISAEGLNNYHKEANAKQMVRSQIKIYEYYQGLLKAEE